MFDPANNRIDATLADAVVAVTGARNAEQPRQLKLPRAGRGWQNSIPASSTTEPRQVDRITDEMRRRVPRIRRL
jgi:hypothetical protein